MDGIQPITDRGGFLHTRPSGSPHASLGHAQSKSAGDYLRALRRRIWLVVAIALGVALPGTVWTIRRPAVYRVAAQIMIEPPQFDPILTGIVSQEVGRHDAATMEKYVPNRLALLRNRALADRVMSDPSLALPPGSGGDPASELIAQLQTRQLPNTNLFDILLEGTDPVRTTRTLNTLLELFKNDAKAENSMMLDVSKNHAVRSLDVLNKELTALDESINKLLKGSPIFAPGGKNLLQDHYVTMNSVLLQKKIRYDDLLHQARVAELFPNHKSQYAPTPRDSQIAELKKLRKYYTDHARRLRRTIKHFDSDPAAKYVTEKLADIMEELTQLEAEPKLEPPDLSGIAQTTAAEEIEKLDQEVKSILQRLQESMPKYQDYLTLLNKRDMLVQRLSAMQARISNFEMLAEANSRKQPVTIVLNATEPPSPIKPNRLLLIGCFAALGLTLGGSLVWLLEHLDHSVKAPEQLSVGLTLPLLGVIPRIRRTANVHRGGHLWTPGAPGSLEADAYRNLRASLLGASGLRGPITTLLVTSAKPGEGKSTTALNLAATCARSGERTLLMDVDLRRPSLGDVFDGAALGPGLVDILRGDLAWQRAVVRTDRPNLDFLPTGDTLDIPIEILGTLELRQLLTALSRHYDRVILDGPAVLGMADCRMLGRIVDGALLVVRCGAHDLRPLRRAKSMLEQSQVLIVGVVFNGLTEDLKNWSSYGGYGNYGDAPVRSPVPPRGLPAPTDFRAEIAAATLAD
jgi:succinoglycan biosynthesis transport protein ExoP